MLTPPPNPIRDNIIGDYYASEYMTPGYSRLVRSLSAVAKKNLKNDMRIISESDAANLADRINNGEFVTQNISESRKVFITALKALKLGFIETEQVVTLHILNSAICDFIVTPSCYLAHDYTDRGGNRKKNIQYFPVTYLDDFPNGFECCSYNAPVLQKSTKGRNQMSSGEIEPFVKQFFALTNDEWERFCNRMENAPPSEQKVYLFSHPVFGCWSCIVAAIKEETRLLQELTVTVKGKEGFNCEKKFLAPSFTILQAVLDVKAETLGCKAPRLTPVYGASATKVQDGIPLRLYLPELYGYLQYSRDNPDYHSQILNIPREGPFARLLYDFYTALNTLAMTENVVLARYRLAEIAKLRMHTRNKSRYVSEILQTCAMIHSYPRENDTIFKDRPEEPQKFGDLFYINALKNELSPKLKEAFIKDMVEHADDWKESFNLGRDDLREQEQAIYDKLKEKLR